MPSWLWRLVASTVLVHTAVYVIRPLLTYRAVALGAGEVAVGALVVAFTLCPAFVALPVGRYCDRHAPAVVGRGGTLLMAVGALGLALAPSIPALWFATMVLGLGSLAVMVAAQAQVARLRDGRRLDTGFGVLMTAVSAGQMVGPVLGGVLVAGGEPGGEGATRAFILAGAMMVPALALWWPVPVGSDPVVRPESRPTRWTGLVRKPAVAGGILASAAILSAVDLLVAYLPLIGERNGIDPVAVGLLLSARAAASVFSRALIPALLRVATPGALLVLSLAASGVLLPAVALAPQLWVLGTAMVVLGCFLGLGQPLTMSMLVRAVPQPEQAASLSLRLSGSKFGQVLVAACCAGLAGIAGLTSAFAFMGATMLGAATTLAWPNRPPEGGGAATEIAPPT